MKEKNNYRF